MPGDVNATYNWWRSTDTARISQTIYDFKNDFNLGTVNFVPFLTAPNPAAPTIPTTLPTSTLIPFPSESPSSTPTLPPTDSPATTPTPSQEPQKTEQIETIAGVAIVVTVFGAGLGLLVYLIKRK